MKPDDADAHYCLGLMYYKKDLDDLFERHLDEATRLKSDLKEAHQFIDDLIGRGGGDV